MPFPVHPRDHHLLKMRQPGTVAAFVAPAPATASTSQDRHVPNALDRNIDLTMPVTAYPCVIEVHMNAAGEVESYTVQEPKTAGDATSQVAAEAESAVSIKSSDEQGSQAPEVPAAEPVPVAEPAKSVVTQIEPELGAAFVGDGTIADGSVLPPAAIFTKTWLVVNSGNGLSLVFRAKTLRIDGLPTVAWPATQLINVGGFAGLVGKDAVVDVPSAAPGETVEISVVNIQAP